MANGANTVTDSFSITKTQKFWIDNKLKQDPRTSKSFYVQKGLDIQIAEEKHNKIIHLAPSLFLMSVGAVIAIFGAIFTQLSFRLGLDPVFSYFLIVMAVTIALFGVTNFIVGVKKWKLIS